MNRERERGSEFDNSHVIGCCGNWPDFHLSTFLLSSHNSESSRSDADNPRVFPGSLPLRTSSRTNDWPHLSMPRVMLGGYQEIDNPRVFTDSLPPLIRFPNTWTAVDELDGLCTTTYPNNDYRQCSDPQSEPSLTIITTPISYQSHSSLHHLHIVRLLRKRKNK